VAAANVLGGTRPKNQSAEGYDTITRLGVTGSITDAIAIFGIHPKMSPDMEKYAPQMNGVYEDVVCRNKKYSGRYEKLRDQYISRDVVSAAEFMKRNMTKNALGTDQDSLFQSTPLTPLIMSLTHQLSKVRKDVNKPLLSGGLMSNNVPQQAFRAMSDTTPHAALYMITDLVFLCRFLFQPMNSTPELEQQFTNSRQLWMHERKKHYKSAGRSSHYNMGDDDIDDYCILDASSAEDSLTHSHENDTSPEINVPRSQESDSNDDDDDDSVDDDSDWMPQDDHGNYTTNVLIIIIVPHNPSLTFTNCKTY
jgi:hypothetical protein